MFFACCAEIEKRSNGRPVCVAVNMCLAIERKGGLSIIVEINLFCGANTEVWVACAVEVHGNGGIWSN